MKKFCKKMNFEQARIITVTTSIVLSLISTALMFLFNYIDSDAFPKNLLFTLFLYITWYLFNFLMSYLLVGLVLFDLPEKEAKEDIIQKYNLTQNEYTEVDYNCVTATNSLLPFLLLVHAKYYFYAKLNENEELLILIKNENQDVIYDDTVRFQYFQTHFKKIK